MIHLPVTSSATTFDKLSAVFQLLQSLLKLLPFYELEIIYSDNLLTLHAGNEKMASDRTELFTCNQDQGSSTN